MAHPFDVHFRISPTNGFKIEEDVRKMRIISRESVKACNNLVYISGSSDLSNGGDSETYMGPHPCSILLTAK